MLLSQSPEWMDLEPQVLPQDAQAAVSIQYTTEYADTFGLLYAAMAAGEKSPRVLRLTRQCIDLSNAHYTAWDYRFQCLVAVDGDMEAEWTVCHDMALQNAKNYQLWNHRRRCAMRMGPGNAPRELEFAAHHLEHDAKNYHIWAHRQALVAEFGLWTEELAFVEGLLSDDVRNNSALNQRAWLLTHHLASLVPSSPKTPVDDAASPSETALHSSVTHAAAGGVGVGEAGAVPVPDSSGTCAEAVTVESVLRREADYARTMLATVPHNEGAWNYLCALPHLLTAALELPSNLRASARAPPACLGPESHTASVRAARDERAPTHGLPLRTVTAASAEVPAASEAAAGPHGAPVAAAAHADAAAGECRAAAASAHRAFVSVASDLEPLLRGAPAHVRAALRCAVRAVDGEIFSIALAVLADCPSCVPARAALLLQYARAAGMAAALGHVAERDTAAHAVRTLVHTLVTADPLRAAWYRSVAASIA